jgi:hypothetical protein
MLNKTDSERIFLQPIDQLYDTLTTQDSPCEDNIFDKYSQGVIESLNISTDSETLNLSDEYEQKQMKLTERLVKGWKERVDFFKTFQCCLTKSCMMQKFQLFRSLKLQIDERSRSCPTVVNMSNWKPVNPFTISENESTVNEALERRSCTSTDLPNFSNSPL